MADVTTTSQSGPPSWLVPYYQNYLNGSMQVANRPYQQYQGPRVAGMSDITQNALQGYQGNMYGNPLMWQSNNQLSNIIGGGGQNPYINQVGDTISADANKQFQQSIGSLNDVFSNPNSFGGPRHALGAEQLTQDFGRGLGQSLGNLKYGAYNDDMNRRLSAIGQANNINQATMSNLAQGAQLGNIPRSIQQQQYDTGYNDWQNYWNYPMQQSQFFGNALGAGSSFRTGTQTSPGPSNASQILGGGLLLGQGLASFLGNKTGSGFSGQDNPFFNYGNVDYGSLSGLG